VVWEALRDVVEDYQNKTNSHQKIKTDSVRTLSAIKISIFLTTGID
jgi:hypothetical protein